MGWDPCQEATEGDCNIQLKLAWGIHSTAQWPFLRSLIISPSKKGTCFWLNWFMVLNINIGGRKRVETAKIVSNIISYQMFKLPSSHFKRQYESPSCNLCSLNNKISLAGLSLLASQFSKLIMYERHTMLLRFKYHCPSICPTWVFSTFLSFFYIFGRSYPYTYVQIYVRYEYIKNWVTST